MANLFFDEKKLFWASAGVVSYFGFVYLNYAYFKLDFVLLGVFQEIALFPLMALQVVLLFFALKNLFRVKISLKTYSLWTALFLSISTLLTWGSFVVD